MICSNMTNDNFSLKVFLKENNLTAKTLAENSGYNKNTITNWCSLTSDEKLPQDLILHLLELYPAKTILKHFPTYAKIIKASTN